LAWLPANDLLDFGEEDEALVVALLLRRVLQVADPVDLVLEVHVAPGDPTDFTDSAGGDEREGDQLRHGDPLTAQPAVVVEELFYLLVGRPALARRGLADELMLDEKGACGLDRRYGVGDVLAVVPCGARILEHARQVANRLVRG